MQTIGNALSRFADGSSRIGTPTFYRVYGNTLAKIYHDSEVQEKNPTLYEMANFIHQRNLPLFVINTTVQRLGMYRDEKASLWAGVFEMTPQWLGSPALSHRHLPYEASETIRTVRDAVTVSGAAIDAESVKGVGGSFLDFMSYSLGRKIEWDTNLPGRVVRLEPGDIYDGQGRILIVAPEDYKLFERMGPFPINYLYLTDGGHAENLATYALVRRLCQDITIVDSEYDPSYNFGSYVNLKRHLLEEMHVNFEVPDIDNIMDFATADNILSGTSVRRLKPFDNSKPIIKGKIGPFAWGRNEADTHYVSLDVTYIKMSIDERILCNRAGHDEQSAVNWYGTHLVRFYDGNREWLQKNSDVACQTPFPQYSTTNQFYSADRMKAYTDLGYYTIINYLPH